MDGQGQYITLIGMGVQTALYLLGGYGLVIRAGTTQKVGSDHLAKEVKDLKDDMKQLAEVVTKIAVTNERLDNISTRITMQDKRIEELSRGVGWKIQERHTVNGEY